jgi:hypothetical protein
VPEAARNSVQLNPGRNDGAVVNRLHDAPNGLKEKNPECRMARLVMKTDGRGWIDDSDLAAILQTRTVTWAQFLVSMDE